MSAAKTIRWLDLLAYLLQHRFPVTREEIYEAVPEYRADLAAGGNDESVRRKFERDKDELRALGVDIETVALGAHQAGDEPATGYRLRARDFYLPHLELGDAPPGAPTYQGLARIRVSHTDLERLDRATRRVADAGVSALAEAARSARRKLEFDRPLPLASVERVLSRLPAGDDARTLELLQRAVAERIAVRCRYYSIGRDAEEPRVIEPWGLFFSWGRWYCVARARDRAARRIFRLDRMRDAALLKGRDAGYEVPAGFDVHDYVGRAPWDLSEAPPLAVQVRFAFPESRWVLAQGVGRPVNDLLEDGGAIIGFAVRDAQPFLRWLLTFRRAELLEPGVLADELADLRRRVARRYGGAA